MKKIITFITIITMCFLLASCASVNASIFNASYWLSAPSDYGVSDIKESTSYSVKFTASESNDKVKVNLTDASSYKTVLSRTTYGENNTDCYLLETTLKMVGSIDNEGTIVPIDDLITTKAYFLGVKDALRPLYTERNTDCHSVTLNTKTSYNVHHYNYSIKTTYGDNNASVLFTKGSTNEGTIDLEDGTTEYSGIKFNQYIDNEMLLFAPRAITLTSSSSVSFNTIDAISKVNRAMLISADSAEPTKKITLDSYFRNSEKVFDVDTFCVNVAIDSQYSGSPIKAYYANSLNSNERCSLISFSNEMAYGLGTFTYTIKSATSAS